MDHLDSATLDAVAAGDPVPMRLRAHVDGCIPCRRDLRSRGMTGAILARPNGRPRIPIATFAIAAIAAAVILTPLRGAAASFLAIFEPQRVVALPLSIDEMRGLQNVPDLSAYATTRSVVDAKYASFTSGAEAARAARFAIRLPSYVPARALAANFEVSGPSAELVTFSPNAKRTTAAKLEPLPADIAASTLRLDFGAAVIATYDTAASEADRRKMRGAMRAAFPPSHMNGTTLPRPAAGSRDFVVIHRGLLARPQFSDRAHAQSRAFFGGMPLVVAQMPVPRVASTGVSVQRLVAYELDRPGIPPRVQAAFRAIGDLSTTLPIPIPLDKAYTQPVSVDGVAGIGLGDDTGIGAVVIWQKNGMLYVVAATQPARDVLAIANSLR